MNSVSAFIILISLACAYGWKTWKTPYRLNVFDRSVDLNWDNSNTAANVAALWIDQPFDHFDSNEKRTFKIRYYKRLDFWKPNGPIYICMYNEFEDTQFIYGTKWITKSDTLISILANETNGAMFLISPRYSHESLLFNVITGPKNYYKYFNTTQSLADIANVIKFIKSDPQFESSKVVVMGASYTGHLATWMRVIYPDLVDAVVAVSAKLLAKKDAHEHYDTVRSVYEKYGPKDCFEKIEHEFQTIENAFKNATALEIIKKKYGICKWDTFTDIENQQAFMNGRFFHYGMYLEMGNLEKIKKCEPFWFQPVGYCCDYNFTDFIDSVKHLKMVYGYIDINYLKCSEFGHFETSSEKQPFVKWAPLDYYLKICSAFGIDEKMVDEGIEKTNRMFGGITPNVTNVVFTQGELCPDRFLGVQQNLSNSAPAFIINESGCFNIFATLLNEPKEVVEIREHVKSLLKKWIGFP